MAKIILGPLVSAASGAIGSVVFRNTRNGPVLAKKETKAKTSSVAMATAQANWVKAQHYWRLQSEETRKAWTVAASSITVSDRLSQRRQLSGWQLFLSQAAWNQGVPYASNSLPPPFATAPFFSVSASPSLSSVLIAWVLSENQGVNVRVHIDGFRPGTTKTIAYAKAWTRLYTQTGGYAASININPASWPSGRNYSAGETMRFRLRACAYGGWLNSPVEISCQIP